MTYDCGQTVSRVAHAVGYATPSAFLAAFRRTVGTSPRRYLSGDAAFEVPSGGRGPGPSEGRLRHRARGAVRSAAVR
ncbi:AraC family transcriptional regulator [Streptomyces coeruleorubidus]|uniref:AraC family transcriptional regulator n=1 Tax=Streptomyces coeruleorubidus TaxID=116188 RepID=A0ABZ0KLW5_STRC4|nr:MULTISPECIES: helix-turn-helix domain-containing protein [Streptomyces]WOT39025.1 AraC family transcriptional regulator [Streptomyces coeruleorubidus]